MWYSPIVFLTITVYILLKKRYIALFYLLRTLPRDLHIAKAGIRLLATLKYWEIQEYTVHHIFQKWVKKFPQKVAFRCEDRVLTFQQVENITNQLSRYFKEECNLSRGDCVAILLPNSEYYPCYWMGLSKIGVISALINTNQVGKVLEHSLKVSEARTLIYDTSFTPVLKNISEFLKDFKLLSVGEGEAVEGSIDFWKSVPHYNKEPLTGEINKGKFKGKLLYIYTSGTTGLPKAAIITNLRAMMMSMGVKHWSGIKEDDVIYDSLPMYHTAGGVVGCFQTLLGGSTVVIRQKFSASNFWSDCIKYDCTVAQYIGEICRFLLLTPTSPKDRAHSVRLVVGNGLRPQIWEHFVQRFNIKDVCEFYGATEGNSNLINCWNHTGAVGYVPWFAKTIYPVDLIKVDESTLEPIRDPKTGLCIRCKVNEPGLCVGKILKARSTSTFSGYVDVEATKKKIIRDVFSKGDSVVNSGDLLVKDELGYFYFRDRTGDTFRWRGENVSTSEVEAIISNIVGLKDATVYGVEIPGVEGRAGMVAIMDEEKKLDLNRLEEGVKKELSSFARPVFVRVINSIPMTGTFKIQKNKLQNEGYDPKKISDPLYFFKDGKEYVKLDEALYKKIVNNEIKL
ncbi:long-chain fatty acid transport protein 1-like isoform X2 [Rhodnius prolixus]|uniref:long-chain fatty acid transport protein 1-like isoform X2 n=1 Tax=Rhodnius prolixus TaxID=13249 RepID=UPI003D18ADA8